MREIKFRGKAILNGEWIKGYLFYDYNNADEYRPFITYKSEAFLGGVNEQQIDKDTIGQYTGLHDKNGKEIYEGDIVKGTFYGFPMVEYDYIFQIYWDEKEKGFMANYFEPSECEVIGNIYENPELLEER